MENPELVVTEEPVGSLLADLERRQDDVLAQLDDLDRRVSELLRGLGVTLIEDSEAVHFVDETDEDAGVDGLAGASAPGPVLAALPMDRTTQKSEPKQGDQDITLGVTGGFSKLPKGDRKSHSGKMGKSEFNDTEVWQQKSRAA